MKEGSGYTRILPDELSRKIGATYLGREAKVFLNRRKYISQQFKMSPSFLYSKHGQWGVIVVWVQSFCVGRWKVPETGGGDWLHTWSMHFMPLSVHIEMVEMAKFSVTCILVH